MKKRISIILIVLVVVGCLILMSGCSYGSQKTIQCETFDRPYDANIWLQATTYKIIQIDTHCTNNYWNIIIWYEV